MLMPPRMVAWASKIPRSPPEIVPMLVRPPTSVVLFSIKIPVKGGWILPELMTLPPTLTLEPMTEVKVALGMMTLPEEVVIWKTCEKAGGAPQAISSAATELDARSPRHSGRQFLELPN